MTNKTKILAGQRMPRGKQPRILLVDDRQTSRKSRAAAITGLGCAVDQAANLLEARAYWGPALYDLVVIDLRRHPHHALDLCGEIKHIRASDQVALCLRSARPHSRVRPDFIIAKNEGVRNFGDNIHFIMGGRLPSPLVSLTG
jgi:CheY-like chemotaxis protein